MAIILPFLVVWFLHSAHADLDTCNERDLWTERCVGVELGGRAWAR